MTRPELHLAFLPYPAYGHLTPALPVVSALVARGHRVTCFATEQFLAQVSETGAEVRSYRPPLSSDPPPDVVDADECARAPLKLLNASTAVLPSIEAAFASGPPDAVVYDTTLWLPGRLLARKWHRPSIQLAPTFCSNDRFSLADQHQRYAGQIDPTHPAIAEFAARLRAVVGEHGLAEAEMAELFHGATEFTIAFLPRQFQVAGDTFDERFEFVGPARRSRTSQAWSPPAGDQPVLLMSLGTTVNNRPDIFRHCAKAFGELPWHTVIALGGRIDPAELGTLPRNVEVHRWIPLDAVLPHARVFVSQAGMGSIMEALYFGVPLVAVPHHPEQQLNADRLTELGLARVVTRDEVSPETLRAAVLDVAGDTGMARQVRQMQLHVRAAGGAGRAADVIEVRSKAMSSEAV